MRNERSTWPCERVTAYADGLGFRLCDRCAEQARGHAGRLAVFQPSRKVEAAGDELCAGCLGSLGARGAPVTLTKYLAGRRTGAA